ncbi:TPA: oligosaccharide flippase family protein [Raoultella planticola]|uniref:oligosaccharide flippase family protein n=1 Tax=Raoultella planticola TaxID=575 RepID=UPI000536F2AD|nr:oligosaccharide flippase family protein [Raoultella planticola]AUU07082.1 polysaccharide biosynthesis protein [Raoultella planticola]PNK80072.1 polysaccharide biosynthesis protein [Raoultella planticola]HDG9791027.1 oligosaccharide flippase family protein [Raoultella planticola]HDH7773057.1 oligosaccharide flippase family protein [Raoultella planticola]
MNRKVISNSIWMMSEKLVSIVGLIFVTSFVAKYVGPKIFGEISFATSLFQIVQIISQFGSDIIIFKRIGKSQISGVRLIISTVYLRLFAYVIITFPVIFYYWLFAHELGFVYIIGCMLSCFFMAMDVFAIYNDATLNSKINTIVNVAALIICLFLRWLIAFLELDPRFLVIPIILTGFIPFIIRWFYFRNKIDRGSKVKKKHQIRYIRYMFCVGSTFVISTISGAIYTRMSMLLLGVMTNKVYVGIYAVAVSLSACWTFVCNAFITSTLPGLFSENKDDKVIDGFSKLLLIVFIMSLPFLCFMIFFGKYLIGFLYGDAFTDAYIPLIILTLAAVISMLGTVSARLIAKYSGYTFLSKKSLCVAFTSSLINIPLIYQYGIIGAAVATFLTELISMSIYNYPFKNNVVFHMHVNSLKINKLIKK